MRYPPVHEATGTRGVVAAKHGLAAEAGLEMLRRGGNAVDAAVAAAFASGVVEPWMSGIGGGGYMVIRRGDTGEAVVVDYSLRAPLAAREDMFEIVPGRSSGLFPWPLVRDDANHQGWLSVAVPGTVAGLALALERFGRLDLATVMEPAIRLAAEGFPVTWYATLRIAVEAPLLARYPETARIFLPGGLPARPAAGEDLPPERIVQPDLAETLRRIARGGADEFYRGETARRIAAAMKAAGGLITEEDLARYRAEVVPALVTPYRGWQVATPPGPAGGVSLAQMLRILEGTDLAALGHNSPLYLHRVASAMRLAFEDRYARLADGADWEALLSGDHVATLQARLEAGRAPAAGAPGEPGGTSTTHLAAADAQGNVVSCTQTLLSLFGSRVTVPGTGILLNNGMFWFDPEPGKPNSPGPGKRPLSNMAPLVAVGPGGWPRVGLGSSGGRRILGANLQILLAIVDGGLGLGAAIGAPRIDVSTGRLLADRRLGDRTLAALAALGHDVVPVSEAPYPQHFASPAGVMATEAGLLVGAVDPIMPAEALAF